MRGYAGLAVMGMMAVLAAPATARDRPAEVGEANSFRPVVVPARDATSASQSVAIDARDVAPAADPRAPRLFGSVPVAENVDFGVGLFSVIGTTEREQARRRLDPSREFRNSATRVAAVGMSLRF